MRADLSMDASPTGGEARLDGVYVRDAEGSLVFHPLPAPSAEEVAQVAACAPC